MWMPCTVLCRSRDEAQPLRSTLPHSVPAHSAANEMKPIVAATRCTLSSALRMYAGFSSVLEVRIQGNSRRPM
jgi:hypothetical protein